MNLNPVMVEILDSARQCYPSITIQSLKCNSIYSYDVVDTAIQELEKRGLITMDYLGNCGVPSLRLTHKAQEKIRESLEIILCSNQENSQS